MDYQGDCFMRGPAFYFVRLGLVVASLLALNFFLASPASAAFEGVGIFAGSDSPPVNPGEFPEEVQLGGVGGMAVNINGTPGPGGVPAGTVYAATKGPPEDGAIRVVRYTPQPDGTLRFAGGWEVKPAEGPYNICGPAGSGTPGPCPARPKSIAAKVDVDVDQTSGRVYVFIPTAASPGQNTIVEYTPTGSEVKRGSGKRRKKKKKYRPQPPHQKYTITISRRSCGRCRRQRLRL